MLSFFIQNFGCRVNQAEAFAWAETLQAAGLGLADDWRGADVVIVNTCTLTGRADRDVCRFLRRVIRESPVTRLAITGCASEQVPKDILGSPQVILTVRNADKEELAARLLPLLKQSRLLEGGSGDPLGGLQKSSPRSRSNESDKRVDAQSRPRGDEAPSKTLHREPSWAVARDAPLSHVVHLAAPALDSGQGRSGEIEDGRLDGEEANPYRARAFVKIQDGCDDRCTFCIIPSVRGGCRSVPVDDVVGRIQELTDAGFREIVLAGIHLSSYGEDLGGTAAGPDAGVRKAEFTLTDLLRKIEKVPGLGRVRLSSLDPRKIDDAFIAQVAGDPMICQHFHLSLQHASAGILKKMGRLGSAIGPSQALPRYEMLLSRLRSLSPEAAIGADIIVGFPGETDEDFATLEAFLGRSPLLYFHVFSYSPRRGTPAAGWSQVPEAVKSARAKRLRRLSAAKNLEFRRSLVGKDLEAIVISAPGNGSAELLTGNYVRVSVPNCPASRRDLVRVRITRVLPARTEGVLA